jgi:hypothetical protein
VVLVRNDVTEERMILFNLMMEAILSSETSVLTRATRRSIPEVDILLISIIAQFGDIILMIPIMRFLC